MPDKVIIDLVNSGGYYEAGNLRRLKEAINVLQRKDGPMDATKAAFDEAMAPFASEYDLHETGFRLCTTPDQPRELVTRIFNAGAARISREKLLERGVDPADIDFATERTPSEYWKIEELPAEEPL